MPLKGERGQQSEPKQGQEGQQAAQGQTGQLQPGQSQKPETQQGQPVQPQPGQGQESQSESRVQRSIQGMKGQTGSENATESKVKEVAASQPSSLVKLDDDQKKTSNASSSGSGGDSETSKGRIAVRGSTDNVSPAAESSSNVQVKVHQADTDYKDDISKVFHFICLSVCLIV